MEEGNVAWLNLQNAHLPDDVSFHSRAQAQAWVNREIAEWEWLWSAPQGQGSVGSQPYTRMHNSLRSLVAALSDKDEAAEQAPPNVRQMFAAHFAPTQHQDAIYPSQSIEGQRILAIRKATSVDVGRWAERLERGAINFANLNGANVALVLRAASFDENTHSEIGETLRNERAQYRREVTRLENRVRELEAERNAEHAALNSKTRRLTRRLLRSSKSVWDADASLLKGKMEAALSDIAETEDRYRNQMALLAPVQYWKGKATTHGKWELGYGVACLSYFAIAAFAIAKAAGIAIDYIAEFTGPNATSAYLITGGALLGGTTLLFWLGRVLVKLFLSEHHLRSDCNEKAVMTEAYLSMNDGGKLNDTDRAIILNSIFRSSPDGIVREEGPSDFAGNALLAKVLAR